MKRARTCEMNISDNDFFNASLFDLILPKRRIAVKYAGIKNIEKIA